MQRPAATLALALSGLALALCWERLYSECYTANGVDYRGTQNQTALHGGRPCLFWNETFQHPYNTWKYPHGEGGLGEHNYCRNPDGDVSPWCYIADCEDEVYWKYCEIPSCRTLIGSCGGNYTSSTSVIYSPDFPDTYATGRVCYWTIQIPGASQIQFDFTLFDIKDSTDMVEVLDGYTYQVLARFDGRSRPPISFNVSLDFVILYFFSDQFNQAQGFAVVYRALKDKLHQDITAVNQKFTEVITEQANIHINAAQSSKILYVITTSPSHPRNTMPDWTIYGLTALLILTVTAILARILLNVIKKSHRAPSFSEITDSHQAITAGEIWSIFYKPSTSISIFKKKLKSQQDDCNLLVGN